MGALAWAEVVGVGAHATAEARGAESAAFGNDVAWPERRAARYWGARAGAAVEAVRIPIGCRSGLLRVQKNRSAYIHGRYGRPLGRGGWQWGNLREGRGGGGPGLSCCGSNIAGTPGIE